LQRDAGGAVEAASHAGAVDKAGGDGADLRLARSGVVEHGKRRRALSEFLGHGEKDVS
jgi:hypothetical protein